MVLELISNLSVGVCLFDPQEIFVCLVPQSYGTQIVGCIYMEGDCDISHQMKENFPNTRYIGYS